MDRTKTILPALFAATLLLSSYLLFLVQPLVAKMMLPMLGGAPAVWNTSMVFFQVMLLAGYGYAHLVGSRCRLQTQIILHMSLLLLAASFLPIGLTAWTIRFLPTESNPSVWLLMALFVSVGLPFFVVAANSPLLQRWFTSVPHPSAGDPYFLYATSNAGSLAALLGYPFLIEPRWRLGQQSSFWTVGFLALVGLILLCGIVALSRGGGIPSGASGTDRRPVPAPLLEKPPTGKVRARWLLLALAPASLMLGVTTYLTTDIASIPLLWVLPLSIYLSTFIIAFSRWNQAALAWSSRLLPLGAIGMFYILLSEATEPIWIIIPIHLFVFFLAAQACHSQLARERPLPQHLTEFYFWISFGGMLGGLCNALAAPALFARITEYPAALILACLLRPIDRTRPKQPSPIWKDLATPFALGLFTLLLVTLDRFSQNLPVQLRLGLLFGCPLLACFFTVDSPRRFALSLLAVLAGSLDYAGAHGNPLQAERNFFGILRVTKDPIGPFKRLVHGSTLHGRQSTDAEHCCEPLSYYHRTGPMGEIMEAFKSQSICRQVGIVGLGAGSMAAYASADEQWTFYEINPAVVRIARDPSFFTFLQSCAHDRSTIVLGDARLRLREAAPSQYGLLVLDAFSSDAIPLHLITREALALYLSKLAPGGLIAFHISNRYLDLESVLGDLAADAHLVCHAQDDLDPSPAERALGKDASHWLVMVRRKEDLGRLAKDCRWLPVLPNRSPIIWTDDFSNVFSVFKWD